MINTTYECDRCGLAYADASKVFALPDGRCMCGDCVREVLDGRPETMDEWFGSARYKIESIARVYGALAYHSVRDVCDRYARSGKARLVQRSKKSRLYIDVKREFIDAFKDDLNNIKRNVTSNNTPFFLDCGTVKEVAK